MASKFQAFFNNILSGATNPKGNLGDWQHARALYTNDDHRLAPKHKFLYHVSFTLNAEAVKVIPQLKTEELNMLVKSVDLPKYNISTTLKHQYNKKRNLQTRLDYDPVSITFHDDNYGTTTAMWEAYYRYYFRDGTYAFMAGDGPGHPGAEKQNNGPPGAYNRANALGGSLSNKHRFGMDNDQLKNFFHSIQIFQMSRRRYTSYTLVNPIISSWQHVTLDNSDSGVVSNQMTVQYETVWYARCPVKSGTAPKMFGSASGHYDSSPSPLTLQGGGVTAFFGQGGVASGALDVLGDIAGGKATGSLGGLIGTVLKGANVFKNAKGLSRGGLREEGFNILKGALGNVNNSAVGGVANTLFPKGTGVGSLVASTTSSIIGVSAITQVAKNFTSGSSADTLTSLISNKGLQKQLALSTSILQTFQENGGTANINDAKNFMDNLSVADLQPHLDKAIENFPKILENNQNLKVPVIVPPVSIEV